MMQGTIVLSVVVAYEIVRRINKRLQQNLVGKVDATQSDIVGEGTEVTK